jgi:hypothetical protein
VTTVLLLSEFLTDLVEDDAVVFLFNDLQTVVRTPLPRTLLGTKAWLARTLGVSRSTLY